MLFLYQSNRLETLAQMMMQVQQKTPLSSPFSPEHILIQSQGMRRYVEQFLAKNQGIAANIQFSLPAQFAWQLMRVHLPHVSALNPFSSEVLRWRLLALFSSETFANNDDFQAARESLSDYLNNGAFAQYQLAGELADIFDQYLVYRPDWIAAWQNHQQPKELAQEPHANWQKAVWRYLDDGSYSTAHRAQLWQDLLTQLSQPENPSHERYCIFGIASMAPMYLTLLKQLSLHHDVHIFALNPCELYWGDLKELREIAQEETLALRDFSPEAEMGHPLLASLGKQGRDFFNQLSEYEAQNRDEHNIFPATSLSGSLLHQLQYDIQTLSLPEPYHAQTVLDQQLHYLQQSVFPKQPETERSVQATFNQGNPTQRILAQLKADKSIQIHNCHSPLRELTVLKEQLLAILSERNDIELHDIAVLTSNIEPYAPFIEAIFGTHCADKKPLFYNIADVKRAHTLSLLKTLSQLLELFNSRFEVDNVLSLLKNDGLLRAAKLSHDDYPLIADTVKQLNIHWGINQKHRQQFNNENQKPNDLFTWQSGLNRIISGWLLPENESNAWQNIQPFSMNPAFLNIMSRFVLWVNRLCQWQEKWQQAASVSEWCDRTRELIETFYQQDKDDLTAYQQLDQSLQQWQAESELAQLNTLISANVATQHINRFLQSQSDSGFLRGGITFCSMVPMRSLPFKVLCLLGLNDGDFPHNTPVSVFDLIHKKPRSGDRSRRNDDRYLFLESLISAREILYLSYVGKDIRTNNERAASVLLNELIDCVAEKVALPRKILHQNWPINHPLQPFSRQYFSGCPDLFSTRQDYADALNHENNTRTPFIELSPLPSDAPQATQAIEQDDLIQFWRNPLKHFLKQHYAWSPPYFQEEHDSNEPFEEQDRALNDAFLRAIRQHQSFEETAQILNQKNQLPDGELASLISQEWIIQAKKCNEHLDSTSFQALPAIKQTLVLDSGSLNTVLEHLTKQGQILFSDQFLRAGNQRNTLEASDKTHLILLHLIYCASEVALPKTTQLVALNHIITLPEIPKAIAQNTLNNWLKYHQIGQTQILPFIPRLQWEIISSLKENWTENDIIQKAQSIYATNAYTKSIVDYDEVKLIWLRHPNEKTPYESPLFCPLIHELFFPLQECIEAINNKT